jgi:hypothetical protein
MKISYLLYSLLVSAWIFTDAPLYNRSRWWSLGTFILPFLFPYYVIKTRPANKYWKYIGLWMLGIGIFSTAGVVFMRNPKLKPTSKVSSISSNLKEQIQMLAHKSGLSATNFQKAANGLDKISDLDTIPKINEAITMVERAQLLFYQAKQDGDALSDFINQNKLQLQNEGLTAFIGVEGLKNETYFSHRKALREYLNSHKEILEYLRDNLKPIKRGQQPQSNTYSQLYFKYSTALDAHNEAYLKHMKFVEQYSREHPGLFEFIDKARKELREK